MAAFGKFVRAGLFAYLALTLLNDANAQTLRNPQSKARPFGYQPASPVYQSGSDARSQRFNTNYLPKVMEIVNERFREGAQFQNPGAVPLDVDQMVLNYDYDVRAYFIHEGAGYKNTVGVKLGDDHKLLFPDCSYDGNQGVRLKRGDFVDLGLVKQGTKLDLLVVPNGAGGGVGGRYYRLYTTSSLSDDKRQHYVGFWIEDTPLLLFGAEDLLGGGDNDFEDVLVVMDFGLDYDPSKNYYVSTSGNDSFSGLSPAQAFRTIGKSASVVRPGDTVYVEAGTYTENPDFRVAGTSWYPIRYIANGNVVVQSAQKNAWLMTMYYADHYSFDGFRFTGQNLGDGARTNGLYNYHSDVTFRNCEFDNLYYGVYGVYSGTKFDRCRIHDNQGYALYNQYGGLDVKSSEITNNANGPQSYREHFFSMTDTKIEGNTGWALLYGFDPYGSHQPLGANKPIVSNCTIDNNGNGLHLSFGKGSDRITFDRTTFRNTADWEMHLFRCEYEIDPKWRNDWPIERGGSGLYTRECQLKIKNVQFDGYDHGRGLLDYYSELKLDKVTARKNQYGALVYGPKSFAAKQCEFSHNTSWGLEFYNTENTQAVLDSCEIDANGNGLYLHSVNDKNFIAVNTPITNNTTYGLYVRESDVEFTPQTMGTRWRLAGNGYGITVWASKARFDNVTISGSGNWGALTYYSDISIRGCSFTKNGNGLYSYYDKSFNARDTRFDENTGWGMYYHGDGTYYGQDAKGQWVWQNTNGPGQLKSCSIRNNGSSGLYLAKVTTRSLRMADTPIEGHPSYGLYAADCDLEFTPQTMGATFRLKDNGYGITVYRGRALFQDIEVADNKQFGVLSYYADVRVDNCTFARNGAGGFQSYHNKSFKAQNSHFDENKTWGLVYYSDGNYYGLKDGTSGWYPADGPGDIVNCTIQNNGNGLHLAKSTDKTIQMTDTPIEGNTGHGLYAAECELSFDQTTLGSKWLIRDNGYGITTYYGKILFDGIEIADNRYWGVLTRYGDIQVRDCTFTRNPSGGFQSYFNKSFRAENSKFNGNGSWGVSYYSDGRYYGKVDGQWQWVEGATAGEFLNCEIAENKSNGMYVESSMDEMLTMVNTPIRDNPGHGLYAVSSKLKFTGDTPGSVWLISGNGYGITSQRGTLLFDGAAIADNTNWGVLSYYDDIVIKNSSFTRNGAGGFRSYYDKSFEATGSKFNENGSWGFYCDNDGRYYGQKDGTWGWYEGALPAKIVNCDFSKNTSHGMGFRGVKDDRIEMSDSRATENGGIGIYFADSTVTLSPATAGKWVSRSNGYGFHATNSTVNVEDFEISGNTHWGMYTYYSSVSLKNARFSGNGHNMFWYATPWTHGWDKTLTVENCAFENAAQHYGLLTYYGPVEIKNSVFRGNRGDGLYTAYNKSVKVEDSEFSGNQRWGVVAQVNYPQDGSWEHKQLFKDNVQTMTGCTVSDNYQGIYVYNADTDQFGIKATSITSNQYQSLYYNHCKLVVDQSTSQLTIADNGYGPYVANGSDVTFRDVVNENSRSYGFLNSASKIALEGCVSTGSTHGYYQYRPTQPTVMTRSRFEGSTQAGNGWGLLSYGGSVNATNSIFTGFYNGAYLYTYGDESVVPVHDLYNNTLTNLSYWGVYAPNGSASVHNNVITHVASNGGTPSGYGIGHGNAQLSHSHNLIHGFAAPFYRTSDAEETSILKSPRFANADAGDFHLGKGSPAINAGMDTSAIVPYDMEGNPRPSFKVVEIGAYEYTNPSGAFRVVRWQEQQ